MSRISHLGSSSKRSIQTDSSNVNVFIICSNKEKEICDDFCKHFKTLKNVTIWHDGLIQGGAEIYEETQRQINKAHIIIPMLSIGFFDEYHDGMQYEKTFERKEKGEVKVIPVYVRQCELSGTEFDKIKILPRNGTPICNYDNKEPY